jgi:hypothetical protein
METLLLGGLLLLAFIVFDLWCRSIPQLPHMDTTDMDHGRR